MSAKEAAEGACAWGVGTAAADTRKTTMASIRRHLRIVICRSSRSCTLSVTCRCMIIAANSPMRTLLALAVIFELMVVAATMIAGQTPSTIDPKLHGQLKQLFPAAAAFSPKLPNPPHYKAY